MGPTSARISKSQDLQQASAKGAEYCRFQERPRLSPVDFVDNWQVARVNVDAFRALEQRQLAASDIGTQGVLGHAGYLYDPVEWPAPCVGDAPVQVTDSPIDGTGGAAEIQRDRCRRQDTDRLVHIPVFCRAPRCLAAIAELNSSCLPGGAKTREIAQNCVARGEAAAPCLAPPVAV
jgi:hypothetical protein